VQFIDLDREDQLYFIVMEWLDGRSLSRILDENSGDVIDSEMTMAIMEQVAAALDYAHQRGVIHADVKPGNIMVTSKGTVKLIDFGAARVRQQENAGRSRYDPNIIRAATPAYSSMQVLTGEEPVAADDVFSLGCLFYRLVAGYRVFGPRNAAIAAEDGMEPQRPDGVTDDQWSALRKALSYSRVTRFQSPTEFVAALGAPVVVKTKSQEPAAIQADIELEAEDTTLVAPADARLVDSGANIRVERESIMYEPDDKPRKSPWRLAVIGIIIVASAAVVIESGVIDTITDVIPGSGFSTDFGTDPVTADSANTLEDLAPIPEIDISETNATADEEIVIEGNSGADTAEDVPPPSALEDDRADSLIDQSAVEVTSIPQIDFSTLPAPSVILALPSDASEYPIQEALNVREGGEDAIFDLTRGGDLAQPFSVQLVETEYSGNQSPGESGRYSMENDGLVTFDAGQPRVRIVLSMRSNLLREADQDIVLRIQNAAAPDTDLGSFRVTLEDDDQRAYEASLPVNSVSFAVSQVLVQEYDPAVQVDVIRYRADNTAIEIQYSLNDITATEGQDYFGPGLPLIYFSPGQGTARILIPLGQDARPERDETFSIELEPQNLPDDSDIITRIEVMIRDDDS
jgi:serine/threonine protein kinase